ncbi:MAG: hypothetical protein ABSG46_17555 [Candidatus Binataceae bacterium]|jgi:hypothetical protein
MNWNDVISEMQYPHWLMAAGGVLVAVGFIGFVFQKNTQPAERRPIAPSGERSHLNSLPTRRLPPPQPFELDPRD